MYLAFTGSSGADARSTPCPILFILGLHIAIKHEPIDPASVSSTNYADSITIKPPEIQLKLLDMSANPGMSTVLPGIYKYDVS